ncbi:MAG: hypothetical protein ABIO70_31905 [Pseudomonadota bacterium]
MHAFSPVDRVTISVCFERGFELFKKNVGPFVLWGLALAGLNWLIGAMSAGVGLVVASLVTFPASLGLYAAVYATANDQPVDAGVLFSGFRRPAAYLFGVMFVVALILGAMLFVLPAIYLLLALVWTQCYMQGRDKGAVAAFVASISLFNRNLGFCLLLAVVSYVLYSVGTVTFALAALTTPMRVVIEVVGFELLLAQAKNSNLN